MKTSIYDKFDRAVGNLSAYAILKDGSLVAKIVTKRGASLTAFLHWYGCTMVHGTARGGGYDMETAAIESAIARMKTNAIRKGIEDYQINAHERAERSGFVGALESSLERDGVEWRHRLAGAGFDVMAII